MYKILQTVCTITLYVHERMYSIKVELYNSGEIISNLKNLIQKFEFWSLSEL